MAKNQDLKSIKHTVRIYDDELLTCIDDLFKSGAFESKNAIINKAIEFGVPHIYKKFFGGNAKVFGSVVADTNIGEANKEVQAHIANELKKITQTTDDIFVLLNVIEYLTTTIHNIELARIMNVSVTDDQVRAGLMSDLPDNLQKVKDEMTNRHYKK